MILMVLALESLWGKFATPPFEAQRPFIASCLNPDIQYSLACCGIQSGKTLSGADAVYAALYGPDHPVMLPAHIRSKTPMEVWFVSKSYALCETQLDTFRWRTPQGVWATNEDLKRWGVSRGDRFTHWLRPRTACQDRAPIRLRLRTARDPESLRTVPTLGLCWGDEVAYWPHRSLQNLFGRAIVARTRFIVTTSPHGKDEVYRSLALPGGWPQGEGSDPKIKAFGWASADNPYADKAHLARLRRILGREYAKQELDGLFTDAIGYVYGMFDRGFHMRRLQSVDLADYPIRIGGIDPGTRDPYAAGVWLRDAMGIWYQAWEFHETGGSSARFAKIFKEQQEKWEVSKWYTDKRRPQDIIDLRDAGVRAVPNIDIYHEDDRHTIAPMIAVCRELMRAGKLLIGEDHEWTAEEFEKYHYPDDVDEREKNTSDLPVDWMNHHMDAMRYAICSVESLPEDRRPRYRSGHSMLPSSGPRRRPWVHIPTMAESIALQDKRFDEGVKSLKGRDPNRWIHGYRHTR